MLIFLILPFADFVAGVGYSECIPPANELGAITLRNSPYFSNKRFTPLQLSIMYNDTDTAYGFLWELASSTDGVGRINETDKQGMTLLHWAAFVGNMDIVQSLLCFGVDVDAVDVEGNTPLHFSALSNIPGTIPLLVSRGSGVDATNSNGSTPLHLAIKAGVFPAVLALLAHGAKTDIEDNEGAVALDAAIKSGNLAIIKLLKSIDAKEKQVLKTELYQWTDKRGGKNPVVGGNDVLCNEVYVGRVKHEGNIIPAKVCPIRSHAYAAYNGKELFFEEYEIMDSEYIAWKPMKENKEIPNDAFVGGRANDGKKLYVGRAKVISGGIPYLTPGKVDPSDKLLRVTFGFQEHTFNKYEILILH